jgi:hypothetical protein
MLTAALRSYGFLLFGPVLLIGISVFFPSCSARIEGTLRQDGTAELRVEASLEPRMTVLIHSLSRMMGSLSGETGSSSSGEERFFDGPSIAKSMAAAPGVAAVSLANTGPTAIAGTISLSRVDAFPAAPVLSGGDTGGTTAAGSRFIRYEPEGRLLITVDRASAPLLLSSFSPEISDYLSALMAPVVTGENLSRSEYLDLVASFYGRPLADEIAASRIAITIDFPRSVTAIKGGTARANRAQFSLPLTDLLVPEKSLVYEVVWK